MSRITLILLLTAATSAASAREYHVSTSGDDQADGSLVTPLRTISAAARLAHPEDVITVHQGVYRERVNPPRGGISDDRRIVYRAAPGEEVVLKGSEVVGDWKRVTNDTWRVSIPNHNFGDFNPYAQRIGGDWFSSRHWEHHPGAVYLNGHWMVEAITLEHVLAPVGDTPFWHDAPLLNLAWWRPVGSPRSDGRVAATEFGAQKGIRSIPCAESGECIGYADDGDWVRYEDIDLGERTERLELRAASQARGGIIEIRQDGPDGELLGACKVSGTGGWQTWYTFVTRIAPLSGVKTLCLAFRRLPSAPADARLWFSRVDETNTTIWAQFKDANPNKPGVEINVRQSVFYPDKPGINFITVTGFTMMHAATPWAPPTAEQIGLIGTHWSKGWIIEDNEIRYSTCAGITLGKYGDQYDNTSQNTAEGYVKTIGRALENGWSRENVGGHIVRNNRISHCEQAGIVGSLGGIFSTITGNVIHDIHVRGRYSGAEMAGIKLHAPIDTEISRNHISHCVQGIWLDWMAQGTRVSGNLLHDNDQDLYVEVNHGPFLVDNNLLLSRIALADVSQGGAYVHNLFVGQLNAFPEWNRLTPYHPAHSTRVAGLTNVQGGDNRFLNNIFIGHSGLGHYDNYAVPGRMEGNVYLRGARPSTNEPSALVLPGFRDEINVVLRDDSAVLQIGFDETWTTKQSRQLVTTELLGRAGVPDLPFVQPDGSPYRLETDYLGRQRNVDNPYPGPFRLGESGKNVLEVWPVPSP